MPVLSSYVSAVQTLLHDPNAQFYPVATLQGFINEARQQIALEGECIRGIGALNTAPGTQLYSNSAVAVPASPLGIAAGGLLLPRSISFNAGTSLSGGLVTLEDRNWDWFNFYWLGIAAPYPGPPKAWCPFTAGTGGSFYVGPKPTAIFALQIDGVWSPINLATDLDPEAIPFPWTDAVQYYALYLAYTDSQRSKDASDAFGVYEQFMKRARGGVTPLRVQRTFPGGLAARQMSGQAPPTPANTNSPARGAGG
jgi:hypothetical protein